MSLHSTENDDLGYWRSIIFPSPELPRFLQDPNDKSSLILLNSPQAGTSDSFFGFSDFDPLFSPDDILLELPDFSDFHTPDENSAMHPGKPKEEKRGRGRVKASAGAITAPLVKPKTSSSSSRGARRETARAAKGTKEPVKRAASGEKKAAVAKSNPKRTYRKREQRTVRRSNEEIARENEKFKHAEEAGTLPNKKVEFPTNTGVECSNRGKNKMWNAFVKLNGKAGVKVMRVNLKYYKAFDEFEAAKALVFAVEKHRLEYVEELRKIDSKEKVTTLQSKTKSKMMEVVNKFCESAAPKL